MTSTKRKSHSADWNTAGIDLSLNHTGLYAGGQDHLLEYKLPKGIKTWKAALPSEPYSRLAWNRDEVMRIIDAAAPELIAMEDYAHAAKFKSHPMGENGGVVRLALLEAGYSVLLVAPGTLKKYITGNGSAKKNTMLLEVFDAWGFKTDDDNVADSYALKEFAADYCAWCADEQSVTKTVAASLKAATLLEMTR